MEYVSKARNARTLSHTHTRYAVGGDDWSAVAGAVPCGFEVTVERQSSEFRVGFTNHYQVQ